MAEVIDSSRPEVYQIRVRSHLGSGWTDWFEGLTITLEEDGDTFGLAVVPHFDGLSGAAGFEGERFDLVGGLAVGFERVGYRTDRSAAPLDLAFLDPLDRLVGHLRAERERLPAPSLLPSERLDPFPDLKVVFSHRQDGGRVRWGLPPH